jgi:predicted MFS family arabinose efflux permease
MDTASLPPTTSRGAPRPHPLGGFHHLAGQPALIVLLGLAALMGTCGWPYLALLPAIAAKVLEVPHTGYTALLSATGLGALAAALTVAAYGSTLRNRYFIGAGIALVSVGLLGLAGSEALPVALFYCLLIGYGLILFFATAQSAMQLSAADHNRGQVMGVWAMVISGAPPLGNALTGPSADRWGETLVLAVQGLSLGGVALLLVSVTLVFQRRR